MRATLLDGVLVVRPVVMADADELFALTDANREHLSPWMPWARELRHAGQTRDWIRSVERQRAEGAGTSLVLVEGGRLRGTLGLNRVDHVNGVATIGYWLAADAQGRGFMTVAVRALLEHLFGVLGLHRATIEAAPGNRRSRAIPERLGFTEEGLVREVERLGDRWLDHVVYGLLEHEWRASRP